MSFKDFTFHNYPQKISMEPYIKAREELINFFKKFDSVVAIYEYGKVAAPGVSDLDIIHDDIQIRWDPSPPKKLNLWKPNL